MVEEALQLVGDEEPDAADGEYPLEAPSPGGLGAEDPHDGKASAGFEDAAVWGQGAGEGGRVRSPTSGETFEVKNGYLELLKGRLGAENVANLTNFLPGAGPAYEPL